MDLRKPPALLSGNSAGGIPFMGMLGTNFTRAQFLITGVLRPKSNAHGPNVFLHIVYAKRLTVHVDGARTTFVTRALTNTKGSTPWN